jgi:hypothetical protein
MNNAEKMGLVAEKVGAGIHALLKEVVGECDFILVAAFDDVENDSPINAAVTLSNIEFKGVKTPEFMKAAGWVRDADYEP